MEASFLEIYNETIRDLLATGDSSTKHEIKQVVTSNGKQANDVFVTNLKTATVKSPDQVRSGYNCFVHSQKHHRLDASCGFYRPDAICQTSCIKPVDFIKLHRVCEQQTCCNFKFARLLQVDETKCIKPVCSLHLAASLFTTCNRLLIIKPEQAMQTHPDIGLVIADCCNLRVSGRDNINCP